MRELVEGKNKIGRTAAVLKKPYKGTFNPFFLPPSFNYLTAFYETWYERDAIRSQSKTIIYLLR